jgi:hypothetical protein
MVLQPPSYSTTVHWAGLFAKASRGPSWTQGPRSNYEWLRETCHLFCRGLDARDDYLYVCALVRRKGPSLIAFIPFHVMLNRKAFLSVGRGKDMSEAP